MNKGNSFNNLGPRVVRTFSASEQARAFARECAVRGETVTIRHNASRGEYTVYATIKHLGEVRGE